jgi:hypothetical protein
VVDALFDLAERPHPREVGVEEGVQVLVVPFDEVEVEVGAFEQAGQRAQEVVLVPDARPVAEVAELQNGLAALHPGVVDEVLEPGLVGVEVAGDEKPRGLVRHLSVGSDERAQWGWGRHVGAKASARVHGHPGRLSRALTLLGCAGGGVGQ